MWSSSSERLEAGRALRFRLSSGDRLLPASEVIDLWQRDAGFRSFFLARLAEAPFDAFLWETPPLTRATRTRDFEFVLVDSPALAAMRPEPEVFREHFERVDPDAGIAGFRNLGGDAYLIAPFPRTDPAAYPHLAAFARAAPEPQQHALWRAVGAAVEAQLGDEPLWVSTSGLGVAWLHVRLDSRPKYYSYRPYRAGC